MRHVELHPPEDAIRADLVEHDGLWALSYQTATHITLFEVVDEDTLNADLRGNHSLKKVIEFLESRPPVDRRPERVEAANADASWKLTPFV
jgi:hypothetical protein